MAIKGIIPNIGNLRNIFPENFDFMKFANSFEDVMSDKAKEMGNFNILIAGKTGVGKSTLINAIFRDELAETGVGAPVTETIKKITKEGDPIQIYDTVGLELDADKQKKAMSEISQLIKDTESSGDNEKIHCVWYCISANLSKVESVEVTFINQLAETGIPVIIVLTKAFSVTEAKELRKYIENAKEPMINSKGVCAVLAKGYFDSKISVKEYGMKELVNMTRLIISEDVEEAFVSAQIADLSMKRKKANYYISGAVGLAAAKCVNPIPGADAPILIGIQMSMMASITYVYGVRLKKDDVAHILGILVSTKGVSFAGITLASFLKTVVGVGNVIAGVINIGVATTLTAALGKTYAYIMEEILTRKLDIVNMDKKKWRESIVKITKQIKNNSTVFDLEGVE
jgi:small GTP-binding protein